MVTRNYQTPAQFSSWLAVILALAAAAFSATYSGAGGIMGAIGVALIVLGLVGTRRQLITIGAATVFGGTMVAGIIGAPPELLLPGVGAALISWDLAQNAISVGRHLGSPAPTIRIEFVHAGGSILVGGLVTVLGIGIFRSVSGGLPVLSLLFLILAAVLLASALSDQSSEPPSDREHQ